MFEAALAGADTDLATLFVTITGAGFDADDAEGGASSLANGSPKGSLNGLLLLDLFVGGDDLRSGALSTGLVLDLELLDDDFTTVSASGAEAFEMTGCAESSSRSSNE